MAVLFFEWRGLYFQSGSELGYHAGQFLLGFPVAHSLLDLGECFLVEVNGGSGCLQLAPAGEEQNKLGFEYFCDLPEQGQRRMLPPGFNVYHRYSADSKSLS
jgi:hypothetical protein